MSLPRNLFNELFSNLWREHKYSMLFYSGAHIYFTARAIVFDRAKNSFIIVESVAADSRAISWAAMSGKYLQK